MYPVRRHASFVKDRVLFARVQPAYMVMLSLSLFLSLSVTYVQRYLWRTIGAAGVAPVLPADLLLPVHPPVPGQHHAPLPLLPGCV